MTAAPINPALAGTLAPPVMEARRWLAETPMPDGRPLLNLSQAAPTDPPPEPLIEAMADAVRRPETHVYGPVLGDSGLRARIAADWSRAYGAAIGSERVAVTAGCNQAFCAAVATLAGPGDAVMLPVPWYFNHAMWLQMSGVDVVPIPCDEAMRPDLVAAEMRMSARVKAIVLVTPNNPMGAEYPDDLLESFYDLARAHGAGLVIDETYRDFHSGAGAPHGLFAREGWDETLVHLYSFSKVFRLTGHRVGAMIAGEARLAEAEKFLDTVTICPPRIGQIAALHGLEHLSGWVAEEREAVLSRRAALEAVMASDLPDWRLKGAGAYFAYVEPPFDIPSDALARRLLAEQGVLLLPGTMFVPAEGDWGGERHLRIAFANADGTGLAEMGARLAAFAP